MDDFDPQLPVNYAQFSLFHRLQGELGKHVQITSVEYTPGFQEAHIAVMPRESNGVTLFKIEMNGPSFKISANGVNGVLTLNNEQEAEAVAQEMAAAAEKREAIRSSTGGPNL